MSTLYPGDLVRLRHRLAFWPAGTEGIVVDADTSLLNGYDVAVQLEDRSRPSCFYSDELERIDAEEHRDV